VNLAVHYATTTYDPQKKDCLLPIGDCLLRFPAVVDEPTVSSTSLLLYKGLMSYTVVNILCPYPPLLPPKHDTLVIFILQW